MRIWDIPVSKLCRQHLLGEHRELHAIWTYLTTPKGGSYRKHPETLRWFGREADLFARHDEQAWEMERRGYRHASPLRVQGVRLRRSRAPLPLVNTIREQRLLLKAKRCECKV